MGSQHTCEPTASCKAPSQLTVFSCFSQRKLHFPAEEIAVHPSKLVLGATSRAGWLRAGRRSEALPTCWALWGFPGMKILITRTAKWQQGLPRSLP